MPKYIEKEAAKEELLSWAVCIKHPEHLMREDAIHVLDSIPAADVAPVVHGRWESEHETWGRLQCSVCKKEALLEESKGDVERILLYVTSNFCPNCGARMDGE